MNSSINKLFIYHNIIYLSSHQRIAFSFKNMVYQRHQPDVHVFEQSKIYSVFSNFYSCCPQPLFDVMKICFSCKFPITRVQLFRDIRNVINCSICADLKFQIGCISTNSLFRHSIPTKCKSGKMLQVRVFSS